MTGCFLTRPNLETRMLPEEKRKSIDEMTLRIIVNSGDGDKVRMNLPMALVKAGLAARYADAADIRQ